MEKIKRFEKLAEFYKKVTEMAEKEDLVVSSFSLYQDLTTEPDNMRIHISFKKENVTSGVNGLRCRSGGRGNA